MIIGVFNSGSNEISEIGNGESTIINTEANVSSVNNKCLSFKLKFEKALLLAYPTVYCQASRQAEFDRAFQQTPVLHNHIADYLVYCPKDLCVWPIIRHNLCENTSKETIGGIPLIDFHPIEPRS
jgi:hypothetical protein